MLESPHPHLPAAQVQSRDEILNTLRGLFEELFEIEPERVTEDAKLYEDLDVDSIDAVDLVVRLKEITGRRVEPEDFKSVRTVGDVVQAVEHLLQA